jgi:hypothetical protein
MQYVSDTKQASLMAVVVVEEEEDIRSMDSEELSDDSFQVNLDDSSCSDWDGIPTRDAAIEASSADVSTVDTVLFVDGQSESQNLTNVCSFF